MILGGYKVIDRSGGGMEEAFQGRHSADGDAVSASVCVVVY